jgi:23S rRNA pseudouridine1911/1915/1917 synthase
LTRVRFDPAVASRPEGVASAAVVTVLRVPPEAAGMRLDRFVQGQLKRTSRTRAQMIVQNSAYDAAGRRLRSNDRVRAEQQVLLWRDPWDETEVPTELPILFEDEHLLAVAKPPHLPVHPTARYYRNTVVKVLEAARQGEPPLKLSHRLDRETSGVLLLAKHSEADRAIKRQLEAREGVEKEYVAITWGACEKESFAVDLPLELDPIARVKVKMRVARAGTGLTARTRFSVLGRRHAGGRPYTMLRCDLETGRQHQIRIHLASIGLPVVGDKLYGPDSELFARGVDGTLSDDDRRLLELERHALHAARLAFRHPITGARVDIRAPIPNDLGAFWESLHRSEHPEPCP